MTTTPPVPENRPELPSASGSHDTVNFVTIFLAIHRLRLSGVLETGTRRGWRRLFFLEGLVVGASSSFVQDELGRTLAGSGLVPKERIQWFEDRLGPDEHIETALLASGALTAEQLAEHEQGRIRQGITAPLRASRGSWRFEACPGLRPERIAPALRPEVGGLQALWEGVQQHLAVDKVLPEVTDPDLGDLIAGPELRDVLPGMELEPPLAFIAEAVGEGISVEELFKQIPDRSGNLLKLVWMLERGGLLLRRDRIQDTNLADRLASVAECATDAELHEALLAWERGAAPTTPPGPSVATEPAPPPSIPRVQPAPAGIRIQPGPASPTSLDSDSSSASSLTRAPSSAPARSRPSVSVMPLAGGDGAQIHIPTPPREEPSVEPGSIGRYAVGRSKAGPASVSPTRSTTRRPERPLTASRIAADHAKRMDRDFYGFLGLKPGTPADVVDRRCKRMAQRWSTGKDLDLDEATDRQLDQLLHGLHIVWQTLLNPERKEEYDRRMSDGHAPRVEEIRRALQSAELNHPAPPPPAEPAEEIDFDPDDPDQGLAMAQRLIARHAFAPACRLLEQLRRAEPSNPEILTDLGWAVWKLKGPSADSENDPEDYIALALTFAPRSVKALEYYARIAFERGDLEALQERLDRLLGADRENEWALEVLSSDALSTSRRGGSGLRFWRRKSD